MPTYAHTCTFSSHVCPRARQDRLKIAPRPPQDDLTSPQDCPKMPQGGLERLKRGQERPKGAIHVFGVARAVWSCCGLFGLLGVVQFGFGIVNGLLSLVGLLWYTLSALSIFSCSGFWGPGGFQKVREAVTFHFRRMSSRTHFMVPSYGQKRENNVNMLKLN